MLMMNAQNLGSKEHFGVKFKGSVYIFKLWFEATGTFVN